MNELSLFLLEWIGAFGIIIGIIFLNSSKASDPKVRIYGSIIVIIGCTLTSILLYFANILGTMIVQIAVIFSNLYGLFNCRKELKRK